MMRSTESSLALFKTSKRYLNLIFETIIEIKKVKF